MAKVEINSSNKNPARNAPSTAGRLSTCFFYSFNGRFLYIHFTAPHWPRRLPSRFNKFFEDGLRKLIFLPSDFRVPLHAENEMILARVDDRFDDPVRRARYHSQIAPDL